MPGSIQCGNDVLRKKSRETTVEGEVNATRVQGKPTFLPGETCHKVGSPPCLSKQIEVTGVSRSHSTEKSWVGLNKEKRG